MESPLDATSGFTPTDDDRPAGEWLEGYWRKMAPWATRFAWVVWAYTAWMVLWHALNLLPNLGIYQLLLVHFGVLLLYLPGVFMGYYAFQFGKTLQQASIAQDQLKLEDAFQYLRKFLVAGIITAAFWGLASVSEIYSTLHVLEYQAMPMDIPLQSE